MPHARNTAKDRRDVGASSVEYALTVSFIAIVVLTAVAFLGTRSSEMFQRSCSSLASTQSQTC